MNAFSLDGVRVERRALPRRDFCVELPLPPESLFAALPGRGRFATPDYADWQVRAGLRLAAAAPPRFTRPVWIAITTQSAAGMDICARPVLDLLLRDRVIAGRALIRELRVTQGTVTGVRVTVRACASGAAA